MTSARWKFARCPQLHTEVSYDPTYDACPLKCVIQRQLQNSIATKILENTFIEGDTILIDLEGDRLDFRKNNRPSTVKLLLHHRRSVRLLLERQQGAVVGLRLKLVAIESLELKFRLKAQTC